MAVISFLRSQGTIPVCRGSPAPLHPSPSPSLSPGTRPHGRQQQAALQCQTPGSAEVASHPAETRVPSGGASWKRLGNEDGSSLGSPSKAAAAVGSQTAVETFVPLLGCAPVRGTAHRGLRTAGWQGWLVNRAGVLGKEKEFLFLATAYYAMEEGLTAQQRIRNTAFE